MKISYLLKKVCSYLMLILAVILVNSCIEGRQPISLHPDNPHYFLFRGKPTVLIGSTEHYGAVLNRDFDYITYLNELAASNLNITRTFSGIYLEPQGAFGITKNTLAPAEGKLICPWARSNQPGYSNGGNKFDLNKWDEEYFKRLKDFISEAGKRKIVVELDLFSNFYDTVQWKLSPLYIKNNINQTGNIIDHKEILSLKHPGIIDVQEKMVRKIVTSLEDCDNLYYEVCNEPYFGDLEALEAWEQHMTSVIADAEKDFRFKHLISQNIANRSQKIEHPNPLVSIFNFHYAKPPVTVEMNFGLDKVIGDNETGFNGIEDVNYRTEGWDFMVAGGGLFDNLDYSFTVGHENGSFQVAKGQPGGGGAQFRAQLKILKQVFDELDFMYMKPSDSIIKSNFRGSATIRVLARDGDTYLVYLNNYNKNSDQNAGILNFSVEIPKGNYQGDWINTKTGERKGLNIGLHKGGPIILDTPPFTEDIALIIRKK